MCYQNHESCDVVRKQRDNQKAPLVFALGPQLEDTSYNLYNIEPGKWENPYNQHPGEWRFPQVDGSKHHLRPVVTLFSGPSLRAPTFAYLGSAKDWKFQFPDGFGEPVPTAVQRTCLFPGRHSFDLLSIEQARDYNYQQQWRRIGASAGLTGQAVEFLGKIMSTMTVGEGPIMTRTCKC